MSQNNPYNLDLLWDVTDNGLRFFEEEFSLGSSAKGRKGFKVRDDDATGSCYISKSKTTGLYLFTDFGGNNITPDQKGVDAIEYVVRTQNTDFLGACKILFARYNLAVRELDKVKPTTEFSSNVTKKEGFWNVNFFSKIQDTAGLTRIFPFYTPEILSEYSFKQVKFYENVGTSSKGLYHRTITATAEFPIYGYDYRDFVKLYAPNAPKGDAYLQKHSFVGAKQDRIIYGLENLISKVNVNRIEFLEEQIEGSYGKEKKALIEELQEEKLDSVIIATGGSDGINMASLGHNVIWLNSETELITKAEYRELKRFVKVVYYCPDLDKTGVEQAVKLGMKLTDIKIIWLPQSLKEFKKKDVADWVRMNKSLGLPLVTSLFNQIVSQAVEFGFWKWNEKGAVYKMKVNQVLQFLKYSGFYQYKIENNSSDNTKKTEERIFVHLKNNVATQVFPADIKEFVLSWLRDNFISLEIQEMLIKSVFFSERSQLTSLEVTDLITKTGTQESQMYFFNDKAVVVKKDSMNVVKTDATNVITWESNIIKRDFKLQDAPFKIWVNEAGEYDISISNPASNYFKVLVNTSRVFWEKDADKFGSDSNNHSITSQNLTAEENQLQKLQLINKIFCVGHLLHKYKMKSKSYLVLGIDRKIGKSANDNKGGSGKSFMVEAVFNYIFNRKIIDGRNLDKDDLKFMLDGVSKETDVLYWEDLSPYYDFNSFFNYVTGEIQANHKGGKIFTIPFKEFAKPVITMNAVPYDITDSLRRRLVVFECSDYYHEMGEEYKETRTIRTDFKKDLFDENYPADDWANDDNFMMYALQFYLNCTEKIEIQQGNLMTRNLIQQIGIPAMHFFNSFFADLSNLTDRAHLDNKNEMWVYKKAVYDYYKEELSTKGKSSQDFKDLLTLYAKFKDWPIEFKKRKIDGVGNSVEHFKIDMGIEITKKSFEPEEEIEFTEPKHENDDLPF